MICTYEEKKDAHISSSEIMSYAVELKTDDMLRKKGRGKCTTKKYLFVGRCRNYCIVTSER